jgi:hypothetical protein
LIDLSLRLAGPTSRNFPKKECTRTAGGVGVARGIGKERVVPKSGITRTRGVRLQDISAQRFIEDLRVPRMRCQQRSQAKQQDRGDGFHDFILSFRFRNLPSI